MPDSFGKEHLPEKERKNTAIFLAVFLIVILHFSSISNELNGLGGDNASYILLAKSLASLNGYRNFDPGNTLHTNWPPVFPLLLVPGIWLFGINFTVCHLVVVLTELIALILLYFLFQRQAGQSVAILSCTVFALNGYVNLSLVRILSEFPCLMVTAAALLLSKKAEDKPDHHIQYLWLPVLVSIVYLTRIAGISLLAAFFLYRIYRKQFKILFYNTPIVIIPLLIWTFRIRLSGQSSIYFNEFWLNYRNPALGTTSIANFIERIGSNTQSIAQYISNYFVFPVGRDLSAIFLVIICGLVLSGFWGSRFQQQRGLMDFYVAVYVLMLVAWPFFEPRKLMPIMPFIYFYLFLGINRLVYRLRSIKGGRVAKLSSSRQTLGTSLIARLICIFLIVVQVPPTLELLKLRSKPLFYPQPNSQEYVGFTIDWSHYAEVTSWINSGSFVQYASLWANYLHLSQMIGQLTPSDAVVIARKPTLTALYSGRRTIGYPRHRGFNKQQDNITKNAVDYILVDGMFADTEKFLIPYIKLHSDGFGIVAKKGKAYLLKVLDKKTEIKKTE